MMIARRDCELLAEAGDLGDYAACVVRGAQPRLHLSAALSGARVQLGRLRRPQLTLAGHGQVDYRCF
jgi:hypothetical protein